MSVEGKIDGSCDQLITVHRYALPNPYIPPKSTSPASLSSSPVSRGHQKNLGCAASFQQVFPLISCCSSITISLPLILPAQKKIGSGGGQARRDERDVNMHSDRRHLNVNVDVERSRSQSNVYVSRFDTKCVLKKKRLNWPGIR